MANQIFENDFVSINHDEKDSQLEIILKKCGNILDETHIKLFEDISELIKQVAPQKLLANMSECNYLITPETGPWHKNPLYKMFSSLPPSRIAMVIPQNLFVNAFFDAAQASGESSTNTKFKYFDDAQQAWGWLNS